jgi:hypothetical protein
MGMITIKDGTEIGYALPPALAFAHGRLNALQRVNAEV